MATSSRRPLRVIPPGDRRRGIQQGLRHQPSPLTDPLPDAATASPWLLVAAYENYENFRRSAMGGTLRGASAGVDLVGFVDGFLGIRHGVDLFAGEDRAEFVGRVVDLELVFFEEPDGLEASGVEPATAVEPFPDQDRFAEVGRIRDGSDRERRRTVRGRAGVWIICVDGGRVSREPIREAEPNGGESL